MKTKKTILALILGVTLLFSMTGCSNAIAQQLGVSLNQESSSTASVSSSKSSASKSRSETASSSAESSAAGQESSDSDEPEVSTASVVTAAASIAGGIYDGSELFTDRDLSQSADLAGATYYNVENGDLTITAAGVYVLSGTGENGTITVDAGDEDKVQLVLNGVSVTNENFPVIYVKNADKVFVTTASGSENCLAVTGHFTADGSTNTDGVIFSKDDIVVNGLGTLTIESTENGIVGKDDLKVTGGTIVISAASKAIEANDSIRLAGGDLTITAGTDGLHAENDEDDTLGYVYISGGSLNIRAGDDGIHANSVVQIDGGEITVSAVEGIEGTYIQINDGSVEITASDDGINAARKSNAYSTPTVEINGGEVSVDMGQGDTDGIDSNGNIIINGGVISVTGQSGFDYDGSAQFNGGIIYLNGTQITEIPNQFGGMGGMPGGMGSMPGGNRGGGRWG